MLFQKKTKLGLKGIYKEQFQQLYKQSLHNPRSFLLNKEYVRIYKQDATATTTFDRHYIYHPAWAARIIKQNNPELHVDISSTLHFCSILSAFVPVKFYDYRPADLVLSNLTSDKINLNALHFTDQSISSLSCMHTVEHIGLGRYGDEIDYDGDVKAMKELARVLTRGGTLLFVVPVGRKSVIHFNGHRIYHPDMIKTIFKEEGLELQEFTLIPEQAKDGGLLINPSSEVLNTQQYACGCFWYKKP